ncbi:MAG: ATPase inhibitor subunit zeta [Pseudomonadota bacterium]
MTFEDFENATRESISARRNHLIALWAGKKIGLSSEALQQYALEVHHADYEEAGCEDVVRKVTADMRDANLNIDPKIVRLNLHRAEVEAQNELAQTD